MRVGIGRLCLNRLECMVFERFGFSENVIHISPSPLSDLVEEDKLHTPTMRWQLPQAHWTIFRLLLLCWKLFGTQATHGQLPVQNKIVSDLIYKKNYAKNCNKKKEREDQEKTTTLAVVEVPKKVGWAREYKIVQSNWKSIHCSRLGFIWNIFCFTPAWTTAHPALP